LDSGWWSLKFRLDLGDLGFLILNLRNKLWDLLKIALVVGVVDFWLAFKLEIVEVRFKCLGTTLNGRINFVCLQLGSINLVFEVLNFLWILAAIIVVTHGLSNLNLWLEDSSLSLKHLKLALSLGKLFNIVLVCIVCGVDFSKHTLDLFVIIKFGDALFRYQILQCLLKSFTLTCLSLGGSISHEAFKVHLKWSWLSVNVNNLLLEVHLLTAIANALGLHLGDLILVLGHVYLDLLKKLLDVLVVSFLHKALQLRWLENN